MMSIFTVTAPASELSLLTIEELRESAGVSDGSQDAKLLRLGRRASASIARRCCIVTDGINPATLLLETCEEIFPCVSDCVLRLARRPVVELVSVTVDGTAADLAGFELNRAAGKVIYAPSGTIAAWPSGRVVVSYKAGFASAPDDLREAAMRAVPAFNSEIGQDPSLKREDIPGLGEREYWVGPKDDPLLSADIDDLIAPYVERWI